jgi:hypothetical protein
MPLLKIKYFVHNYYSLNNTNMFFLRMTVFFIMPSLWHKYCGIIII